MLCELHLNKSVIKNSRQKYKEQAYFLSTNNQTNYLNYIS